MQPPQPKGAHHPLCSFHRRVGIIVLAIGVLVSACSSSTDSSAETEPESSDISGDWSVPLATIDNRDESPNGETWSTDNFFAFDPEGAEAIAAVLLSDDEADRVEVAAAAKAVVDDVDFDSSFVALIYTFACQPESFELAASIESPGVLVLTKRLEPVDCAWSPDWGSVFVIPRQLDLGDGNVATFGPGELPDISVEQIEVD